jgi:hypothetical protein
VSLREDTDQYCFIWLGLLLLGAYYFNFVYVMLTQPAYLPVIAGNFVYLLFLWILPLGMVFFFTGYLRPARGKAKSAALGPSLVTALFFLILTYLVSLGTDLLGNVVFFSAWGIGSSLLLAAGFSVLQTAEDSKSSGILDVSSLHYGPPKAEPEPQSEAAPTDAEVTIESSPSEE